MVIFYFVLYFLFKNESLVIGIYILVRYVIFWIDIILSFIINLYQHEEINNL